MSGIFHVQETGKSIAGTSLTRTICFVKASSTQPLALLEASWSFSGLSATKATIDVVRLSDDGTMQSISPRKADAGSADAGFTAQGIKASGHAEPTVAQVSSDDQVLFSDIVKDGYTWRPPSTILVPPGGRLGIRVTNSTEGITAAGRMVVQEVG